MKRNSNRVKVLALATTLLLALAACNGGGEAETTTSDGGSESTTTAATESTTTTTAAGETVTVTYWHTMSDPETAQLDNVVAAFEEATGIVVETTRFAYDDFKEALLTSLAGGVGPDTARMDIIWVPEFAELGALQRLDGAMPDFDEIANAVFPGPLETNYWDGGYYGLPQNTNTQVLLWNREIFEAANIQGPPTSFGEMATIACELSDPANEEYGFALGGTYFWAPAPVFYAMGGQVVDSDITTADGYTNGPASVEAFTMLKDLHDDGCLSPNLLGGGIGTADGHATGNYAMITDGPWMVDIYAGNYPDFEVNFALVPSGADGTTSSVVGGEDVVLFANSEVQDAAMEWISFLMGEESQKMMAEVGVIPTLSALADDSSLPEYFGVFLEQLATAQARVPHPGWSDMDNAINNAFQRMLNGDQTPQAALDQAAEEINAILG